MGWIFYQIAMAGILVAAAPFLLATRGRHYLETLPGRLGLRGGGSEDGIVRGGLWIHAVSVGEVGVAATLVRALPESLPLVVTTVTPTGQRLARKTFAKRRAAGHTAVAYLPFDFGFALRRFMDRHAPKALVLVEGDYWPLALRQVAERGLPVAVINGRVSRRSFGRLRQLGRWNDRLFFGNVGHFGVQTEEDRGRLVDLGVTPERVLTTGNLKYDTPEPAPLPELEETLRGLAGSRPILIAGSTMKGEEEPVLDAFAQIGGGQRALLVLVPRHPERWDGVARLLDEQGLRWIRRSSLVNCQGLNDGRGKQGPSGLRPEIPPSPPFSKGGTKALRASGDELGPKGLAPPFEKGGRGGISGTPAVILLDSLGELAALYRIATAAFIGGTLVPTGGHNPLEPARFAVPIVVGPSMENFREISETFNEADAWRQVADSQGLAAAWDTWIENHNEASEVGRRGDELLRSNQGALQRTLEMLEPIVSKIPQDGRKYGNRHRMHTGMKEQA